MIGVMSTASTHSRPPAELVIAERFGPLARLAFGGFGLAAAGLVVSDLGPGLWPFGWHSLFFAVIVLGGVSIGATLVFAAIAGEAVTVAVRDGSAVIERHSPFGVRRELLSRGAVFAARAVAHEWDSRADTWRVEITFADGRVLLTPDLASKADAEDAARLIEQRLR
jgi:hypothetical protein